MDKHFHAGILLYVLEHMGDAMFQLKPEGPPHPLAVPTMQILEALDELNDMNKKDSGARSRELSIAITNIETGLLWLNKRMEMDYADA